MSQTPIDPTKIGRGFTSQTFTYDQAGHFYHVEPSKTMQEQNNPTQTTEIGVYDPAKVAASLNKVYSVYKELLEEVTEKGSENSITEEGKQLLADIGASQFHAASVAALRSELTDGEKLIVITLLQINPPNSAAFDNGLVFALTEEQIVNHATNLQQAIDGQKNEKQSLEQLKQETATEAPKTATINGVEVMALKDVETPDGAKPFADGSIVGVFDQTGEVKSIEERLGQPDDFITKALKKAGVPHPGAWMVGMDHRWTLSTIDIKQRIFHINQQLRLYIAEIAVDHSSTIQPRATIVDGVSVEDWYKIISAGILKYMADLMIEHQERVVKTIAEAPATPAV